MCFSRPRVDNSAMVLQQQEAAAARQREADREARIRSGSAAIDSAFAGFDEPFYGQRRDAYMGFYQPQLDERFTDARRELTYALARAGTLNSTVAGDEQARLQRDYDVNRATILSKAEADANSLRTRVGNERSALVSQLNATADADRATNEALSRTRQIYQDQPEYSPLGDIFAGAATGVGQYMAGVNDNRVLAAAGTGGRSPRRTTSRVVPN